MEAGGGLAEQIGRAWWVVVLLGTISVIVGILALAYPDITLLALGIIFGAYLLFWGILTLASAFDPDAPPVLGVLRVLVGFLGLLAGLICLVRPGASLLALLIAVSFWFILTGIADLVRAMENRRGRGWSALLGLLSVAAGVIIVGNPDIGLSTLALLAGIGFIVRGCVEVAVGFAVRGLRPAAST